MRRDLFTFLAVLAVLARVAPRAGAVEPFVSGDVPTAETGTFEWYAGFEYESFNREISRGVPHTEFVYGLWDRQEINIELPIVSEGGHHGFGDGVLGTKFLLVKEEENRWWPGIAASYEISLPIGRVQHGLGTGTWDSNVLVRIQKTWGWFTLMGNVGHSWLSDAHVPGGREPRDDTWFLSTAQRYQLTRKLQFLTEVWWESSETPGEPHRFAGDTGLEYAVSENFQVHGSVGTSLREDGRGGPDLRVYVGFHWVFDAPWKKEQPTPTLSK